mmetsp:Transcript_16756/g.47820  ORF Transcript_16756/g.47820 Transcript_16756/m.47820 type:complete len:201 (-) Transcript_16756:1184-1786(-)
MHAMEVRGLLPQWRSSFSIKPNVWQHSSCSIPTASPSQIPPVEPSTMIKEGPQPYTARFVHSVLQAGPREVHPADWESAAHLVLNHLTLRRRMTSAPLSHRGHRHRKAVGRSLSSAIVASLARARPVAAPALRPQAAPARASRLHSRADAPQLVASGPQHLSRRRSQGVRRQEPPCSPLAITCRRTRRARRCRRCHRLSW